MTDSVFLWFWCAAVNASTAAHWYHKPNTPTVTTLPIVFQQRVVFCLNPPANSSISGIWISQVAVISLWTVCFKLSAGNLNAFSARGTICLKSWLPFCGTQVHLHGDIVRHGGWQESGYNRELNKHRMFPETSVTGSNILNLSLPFFQKSVFDYNQE